VTYEKTDHDLSQYSMLDLFRMEADSQIAELTKMLLSVEKKGHEAAEIEALMRSAHSLKGAGRMVGVNAIVRVAHRLEDCFVAAQEDRLQLTQNEIDVLFKAIDLIGQLAKETDEQFTSQEHRYHEPLTDVEKNLAALTQLSDTEKDIITPRLNRVNQVKVINNDDHAEFRPAVDEERILRVNADRLNRIMGLAGETLLETRRMSELLKTMPLLKRKQWMLNQQIDRLLMTLESESQVIGERSRMQLQNVVQTADHLRKELTDRIADLEILDHRTVTVADRLHRAVLATRMRPFGDIVQGLPRLVRDLSRKLNKQVQLHMSGLSILVDRDVLERIDMPLTHLVQNSLDHGLEFSHMRIAQGKNEQGQLHIDVSQMAGFLYVNVSDDGRGVDVTKLRDKIAEKKLVAQDVLAAMDDMALLDYLFVPGFSTKEQISDISGRGVGLDMVRDAVVSLNGTVRLDTTLDQGTQFQLVLPLTVSIAKTLVVSIGGESFAFLLSYIHRVLRVSHHEVTLVNDCATIIVDGQAVILLHANHLFNRPLPDNTSDEYEVLVIGRSSNYYALVVECIIGERELSIHPLDPQLGHVKDISSAALLEDGSPILIIDGEEYVASIDEMIKENPKIGKYLYKREDVQQASVRVLIVDDSMTVREMERNLLQENGFLVDTAANGEIALALLSECSYQLIITDLDMPHMNGYQLIEKIREDQKFNAMPIMVMSNNQVALDVAEVLHKDEFSVAKYINCVKRLIG